ncbi:MAG TPA: hypothetical protein ENJ20_00060 [Bacteroidetes bacterium]|nr:hypothetical protein [Bacteroidota bacterium]
MKKLPTLFLFLFSVLLFALCATSCHRGYGCKMNENAHIQPNKKGKYKKSKTRSGLFPKGVYKRGH